ncbi:hypothetical protein Flavo103_10870 [Flavobacterium collinsii]|uniref:dual OB domain-containing protein n=1 Tax=Flavobacterium collinsii TaxID=1114861 RepID=UPI0022BD7182|nr:hypothetical protein [Flavobacterium collinsii]GIQ57951.1 hypothetical protein Flavo103_10870 [Flavobacterium collinsii]
MEVLIVSKTKLGENFCMGGIELKTNKYIRLLDQYGRYQPLNTPFRVGQVWDMDYVESPGKPPHIEDVKVSRYLYVTSVDANQYIINNCKIWQGDLTVLYDSKLKWENGSGYLNDPNNLPDNSVGFWQSDKDLVLEYGYYVYNYNTIFKRNKRVRYKGVDEPISVIKANTLIRVSLAKWWMKDQNTESRCYLQLSGWY